MAAILPLIAATAAHAQMKGLAPADVASVARTRALDFRLSQEHGIAQAAPLIRGMMLQQTVGPNTFVGVGMANMYDRKKNGSNLRLGDPPARSRKPAVTFVMKF